jgi:lipid II isoglutaminyl synthase (glutamine-hydrolysing)
MAVSESEQRTLRVCALYPDLMNIYADRGNLFVLQRRCEWRGIGFRLKGSGLGEALDGAAHDIYYIGGGQDRDQLLCAEDLVAGKRATLHEAASRDAVVLGVCGGYQLLGESYTLGDKQLEGVGLLDVRTVREPGERLIGNVAIEVDLGGSPTGLGPVTGVAGPSGQVLAGFENHGGRTYLGPSATPLGRVLKGQGNDGRSGREGTKAGNTIGTYLHGPLLPKNTWFADWLIATALGIELEALAPLDDELELAAHASARRAAGV